MTTELGSLVRQFQLEVQGQAVRAFAHDSAHAIDYARNELKLLRAKAEQGRLSWSEIDELTRPIEAALARVHTALSSSVLNLRIRREGGLSTASAIVAAVQDTLVRFHQGVSKLRSQVTRPDAEYACDLPALSLCLLGLLWSAEYRRPGDVEAAISQGPTQLTIAVDFNTTSATANRLLEVFPAPRPMTEKARCGSAVAN